MARYRGEPYAAPGDISSAKGRVGQCGWTWYTGAAGWMYRIWIGGVLGLRVRGDGFTVDPAIPKDWTGFEMTYRRGSTVFEIAVRRREGDPAIELDGEPATGRFVRFDGKEGTRRVTVWIPAAETGPANEAPAGFLGRAEPSLAAD